MPQDIGRRLGNYEILMITRDGRSLVSIDKAAGGSSNQITVVLNWFQELERLVPTK